MTRVREVEEALDLSGVPVQSALKTLQFVLWSVSLDRAGIRNGCGGKHMLQYMLKRNKKKSRNKK